MSTTHGEQLRQFIKDSPDYTRAKFAEAIGVSASTLARYMSGEMRPGLVTQQRIFDLSGIDLCAVQKPTKTTSAVSPSQPAASG